MHDFSRFVHTPHYYYNNTGLSFFVLHSFFNLVQTPEQVARRRAPSTNLVVG